MKKQNWESNFDLFYRHEPNLGSSAWLVSPDTVNRFITMLIFTHGNDLFEAHIRDEIKKSIERWNESGFYSDCVGKNGWRELLSIIKKT